MFCASDTRVSFQSGKSVDVTLWGETADTMNEERLPAGVVVVIKAAKVSEYQGRSLNASFGSQILVNPDRPEARELIAWATQVRRCTHKSFYTIFYDSSGFSIFLSFDA